MSSKGRRREASSKEAPAAPNRRSRTAAAKPARGSSGRKVDVVSEQPKGAFTLLARPTVTKAAAPLTSAEMAAQARAAMKQERREQRVVDKKAARDKLNVDDKAKRVERKVAKERELVAEALRELELVRQEKERAIMQAEVCLTLLSNVALLLRFAFPGAEHTSVISECL